MSRVTAIIYLLSASSSACHGLLNHYRDNAIVSLQSPARQKCQRISWRTRQLLDMQMRQRDVAALDAKYTKELADAKAENDALRDDVAIVVGCISKQSVSQCEATTKPGVDNAALSTAVTAERDYFTSERG